MTAAMWVTIDDRSEDWRSISAPQMLDERIAAGKRSAAARRTRRSAVSISFSSFSGFFGATREYRDATRVENRIAKKATGRHWGAAIRSNRQKRHGQVADGGDISGKGGS